MSDLHDNLRSICISILSFTSCILFIIIVVKLCGSKAESQDGRKTTMLALLIFSSQGIGWGLEVIRFQLFGHQRLINTPSIEVILYISALICVMISIVLFYSFMGIQLYLAFLNTNYKANKTVIYIHSFIFALVLLFCGIATYWQIETTNLAERNLILAIIFLLLGSGLIHLTYLFNRKLYQVLVSHRIHSKSQTSVIDTQHELPILHVIVKCTVLVSFGTISTCFLIIVALILGLVGGDLSIVLYWTIWIIYAVSQTMNLFLMLSINSGCYGVLCRFCHIRFQARCEKLVASSTNNNGKNMELSVDNNANDISVVDSTTVI